MPHDPIASKVQKDILEQDAALREIVERLVRAYQPERVYLFGSKARGDYGPDSDYDLLLVVPDDAPPPRRRSRLAYEVLRGTGTAVDALVCTRSYFEARRYLKASLPGTVLREGRLLYAGRASTQRRQRGLVAQGKGRPAGGQTIDWAGKGVRWSCGAPHDRAARR